VRLVNKMIMDAFEQGASDIHIESRADDKPSRVRFRIDGVLTPYIEVPPNFRAAFVSRLKIMAELDIAERRRPQDGRILFENWGPRHLELRVVTIPTAGGLEDVVMRILAAPRALSLEQLAIPPRDLDHLKQMAARSYGLLFVCGPTGSGKTTTLHSLLAHINTPDRKIWTVEDPVEITQDGLCQVQVNPKLGLTFAEVLKSFLRADPDVIMVGETRDAETARTVTTASLTGHVVFSTMHTNSAVESVLRLLDLEVDAFNFSDALLGVVGQRLVRKLCQCKRPHLASAEEIDALAHEYCRETHQPPEEIAARWRSRYGNAQGQVTLYAPGGCPECDHSGYKGRLGVYEMLVNTPAVKKAIQQKAASDEILRLAVADGMTTLEQDALEKTMQGHLDLKQVLASCR
jgi:type II secretory ATPase GspE/PulE/Tfp pilus assembly ATPase PilB-like protein